MDNLETGQLGPYDGRQIMTSYTYVPAILAVKLYTPLEFTVMVATLPKGLDTRKTVPGYVVPIGTSSLVCTLPVRGTLTMVTLKSGSIHGNTVTASWGKYVVHPVDDSTK